jgi:hypothetical protein
MVESTATILEEETDDGNDWLNTNSSRFREAVSSALSTCLTKSMASCITMLVLVVIPRHVDEDFQEKDVHFLLLPFLNTVMTYLVDLVVDPMDYKYCYTIMMMLITTVRP